MRSSTLTWLLLSLGCHVPKTSETASPDSSGSGRCAAHAWQSVSTNDYTTCGIHTDGCIECWGNEGMEPAVDGVCHEEYQRCDWGSAAPPDDRFVQVEMAALAGGAPRESYHELFACGVTTDGHIRCWGQNDLGQATPPDDDDFTQVSVMEGAACGLRANGDVTCWGSSFYHGWGFEDTQYSYIETTGTVNCGITIEGSWSCWTLPRMVEGPEGGTVADPPPAGIFTRIGADEDAACAIDEEGALTCIGFWNGPGEVVADDFYRIPSLAPSLPAQDVQLETNFAVVLLSDGTIEDVFCRGVTNEQVLDNTVMPGIWTSFSVNEHDICAITPEGALTCTGGCAYGACDVPE